MSEESEVSVEALSWVGWFCSLDDHQYFAEIDHDFLADPFNHFQLRDRYPNFKELLRLILRHYPPEDEELENEFFAKLHQDASELYGMLHARYILTPVGMALMREKHLQGKFGTCPKLYCEDQKVLPIGMSDHLKTSRLKLYCPRCKEVYHSKRKGHDVDGAFFGPSFPLILLQAYPDLNPHRPTDSFTPKIFGFKLRNRVEEQPSPGRKEQDPVGQNLRSPGKQGRKSKCERAKGKQNM